MGSEMCIRDRFRIILGYDFIPVEVTHDGVGNFLRGGVVDNVPRVRIRVHCGSRLFQRLELLEEAGTEGFLSRDEG